MQTTHRSSVSPLRRRLTPLTAILALALAAPCLAIAPHAAAASNEEKAAARELAIEGIKMAQDGHCEEALPKLEKAESLYHAPTILTWIGECQIETGKLVDGTENLNRVVHEQLSASAPQAFRDAQDKARQLRDEAKPRIARLTIEISPSEVEGVEVTIDGAAVNTALLGAPRPTDPGEHEVVVSAPGYHPVTTQVTLDEASSDAISVSLEIDPDAAKATAADTTGDVSTPVDKASSKKTTRTIGWIGVGVGAALLAGGGVTGAMALNEKNNLDCTDGTCSFDQKDTYDSANTLATTSSVLFGVGGAVAITGVVLLIVGKDKKVSAEVAGATIEPVIGFGSVGLNGSF